MIFLHFVFKLSPDMRKHYVTTMLPKFFCLGLLASKNQFVHAFFTDIVLVRLTVFRPFPAGGRRCGASFQLMFMLFVFNADMLFENIPCPTFLIFKCPEDLLGTCPRFFFNSHNAQFHCIKGKWHNRRYLYL